MSKLRKLGALLAAVLCSGVGAQAASSNLTIEGILGAVPQCALPCVLAEIESAECAFTKVSLLANCLCTNVTVQSAISTCVQVGCTFSDQMVAVDLESQICAAYPKESRVGELKAMAIVTIALSTPVVIARCMARVRITGKLWRDDYMSIVATIFLLALGGIELESAYLGFGLHYWDIDTLNAALLLKLFYVAQILYVLVQVTAKAAIVLLYQRVFSGGSPRWFLFTLWGFLVFLFGHGLIYGLILILQCLPISAAWDRTIEGSQCLDVNAVGYAGAAMCVVEDIALIVLPIPVLQKLQTGGRKRVGVIIMFSVASFATVTSMVRLKYLVNFSTTFDTTYDNVDIIIWSLIEVLCAVICGSLPVLRPYLGSLIPQINSTWQATPKGSSDESPRPTANLTRRSPTLYSTTTYEYAQKNVVSYSLSPVSPKGPSGRWTELRDNPRPPRLPKSAIARPNIKAPIRDSDAIGNAIPVPGSSQNKSENNLVMQNNRVYVTYDIKVSTSRCGESLVGQGAKRTVSAIGTGRPMSAIGAPEPRGTGSTLSLPSQGKNKSVNTPAGSIGNISSSSLNMFGSGPKVVSSDSDWHDFLKPPTQQRPIARISSLERKLNSPRSGRHKN